MNVKCPLRNQRECLMRIMKSCLYFQKLGKSSLVIVLITMIANIISMFWKTTKGNLFSCFCERSSNSNTEFSQLLKNLSMLISSSKAAMKYFFLRSKFLLSSCPGNLGKSPSIIIDSGGRKRNRLLGVSQATCLVVERVRRQCSE